MAKTTEERAYEFMGSFVNIYMNRIKPFFDKGQVDSVRVLVDDVDMRAASLLGNPSDLREFQTREIKLASNVEAYGHYIMAVRLLKAMYNEKLNEFGAEAKEKERGELIKRVEKHVKNLDELLKDNKFYQEQRGVAA